MCGPAAGQERIFVFHIHIFILLLLVSDPLPWGHHPRDPLWRRLLLLRLRDEQPALHPSPLLWPWFGCRGCRRRWMYRWRRRIHWLPRTSISCSKHSFSTGHFSRTVNTVFGNSSHACRNHLCPPKSRAALSSDMLLSTDAAVVEAVLQVNRGTRTDRYILYIIIIIDCVTDRFIHVYLPCSTGLASCVACTHSSSWKQQRAMHLANIGKAHAKCS